MYNVYCNQQTMLCCIYHWEKKKSIYTIWHIMGFPQYMALIWPYTFLQYNCYMGAQHAHHKTKSGMGLGSAATNDHTIVRTWPPRPTTGSGLR